MNMENAQGAPVRDWTREQLTRRLLWIHINHESMRANARQRVFEPPFNEDLVYVMWQYLDRIIVQMHSVPPQLWASPSWIPAFEQLWREIVGKA
ncbi:hypothetical protein LA080_001841 [Diaporthe eres]|nr:hypothetical protein LA080_001841 [Diaporthe eres]